MGAAGVGLALARMDVWIQPNPPLRDLRNSLSKTPFPAPAQNPGRLVFVWYNPLAMIYVNLLSQTMLFIGVRGFISGAPYFNAPALGSR